MAKFVVFRKVNDRAFSRTRYNSEAEILAETFIANNLDKYYIVQFPDAYDFTDFDDPSIPIYLDTPQPKDGSVIVDIEGVNTALIKDFIPQNLAQDRATLDDINAWNDAQEPFMSLFERMIEGIANNPGQRPNFDALATQMGIARGNRDNNKKGNP